MIVLDAYKLKRICLNILETAGAPKDEAEVVADCLVKANLRGINSHGVFRLSHYITKIENGGIVPGAPFTVVHETPSTALVDGGLGFGQVVGVKAMEIAIKKARETGIGAVGAYNTNHFGMAAYYALLALQNDMICVITCNTEPHVVPWGGREPMLGTNPICIAIPSGQKFPIVVDMATSAVALGRIERAAEEGKPIPPDWAVDEEGRPTTDPVAALKGALLPFGGSKGYCLAFMLDVFSGPLVGAACGKDARGLYPLEGKPTIGQFYLAINVSAFVPIQDFKSKVDKLVLDLKSCPPAPGYDEVLIPGEIEYRNEQKYSVEGISLDVATWQALEKLGQKFKVDIDS